MLFHVCYQNESFLLLPNRLAIMGSSALKKKKSYFHKKKKKKQKEILFLYSAISQYKLGVFNHNQTVTEHLQAIWLPFTNYVSKEERHKIKNQSFETYGLQTK